MPEAQQDLVRRSFGVTVRSVDAEMRSVDVIASTDAVDAYGEIVDQSWDLKRYLANPVVLYNHNREGFLETLDPECTLPIGYAENVGVLDGKLQATLVFVDEKANPMGERVLQGFLQKSLRAVSVGFNPRTVRSEKVNDKEVLRLSDNELFEISVTPMGANPEAVAKSRIKSMHDLMARATAHQPSAPSDIAEKTMNEIEELRAKLADADKAKAALEAQIVDTKKALADVTADRDAKDVSLKAVTAERDVARDELEVKGLALKSAESRIVSLEVDALIGTKILPSERDVMVELASTNKTLFDKTIATRSDLKLLGAPIVPVEKGAPPPVAAVDNGDALAAYLAKQSA
jgi:HK97 family phage prohead protease